MSDQFLTCIPDFAASIPPPFQFFARTLKCCQPTGDQLYSILYALAQTFQLVTSGSFGPIQSELESTFTRFAIIISAPWVLVFIGLFVLLMAQRTISIQAGVFFIVITIIMAVLAVVWTLHDVSVTTTALYNEFRSTIEGNIATYQNDIIAHLFAAYILSASCNPNESNSCCGFNKANCISGCGINYMIDPDHIPSSSTGNLEIAVISDLTDISGTITIPIEIAGGTTPTVLTFNGQFDQTITYNSTALPGVYNVEFVTRIGPTPYSYATNLVPVAVFDKNAPAAVGGDPTPPTDTIAGLGGIDLSQLTEQQAKAFKRLQRPCRSCR